MCDVLKMDMSDTLIMQIITVNSGSAGSNEMK